MPKVILKEKTYYEDLKNRIGEKNNDAWKKISYPPYVGDCSYLYGKLKPKSYQDFFDKYIAYVNPDDKTVHVRKNKSCEEYGRSIEDLQRLACYYKSLAVDDSFTLEEYFDDIICHTIIETFDGHKAERELVRILTEHGFDVEETYGYLDSKCGVDLIVRKNGEVKSYIQVKPLSTFLGTKNNSLMDDRRKFYEKQTRLDDYVSKHYGYKKMDIIYMLYDKNHLDRYGEVKWYYKGDKVKFKLEELCDNNGIPINNYRDFEKKTLQLK